jgi:hypothetical protein
MSMQELIKATADTDSSYATLQKALEKVKQVADFINESRRDAECMTVVLNVERQLVLEPKVCCPC